MPQPRHTKCLLSALNYEILVSPFTPRKIGRHPHQGEIWAISNLTPEQLAIQFIHSTLQNWLSVI
jgi:hypothetical protein